MGIIKDWLADRAMKKAARLTAKAKAAVRRGDGDLSDRLSKQARDLIQRAADLRGEPVRGEGIDDD